MENKKRSFKALRNGDTTMYMIAPYEDPMDEDLSGFDYPEAVYTIGPDGEILGSYGDGVLYDDDGNIIIGNDDISDYIEPIILDEGTVPYDYLGEKLLNDERNRILLRRQGGVFSKGGSIINNNMGLYKHGGYLMPRKFKDGGAVGKYKDPAGPLDMAIDYLDKFTDMIPVAGTLKKGAKKATKKTTNDLIEDAKRKQAKVTPMMPYHEEIMPSLKDKYLSLRERSLTTHKGVLHVYKRGGNLAVKVDRGNGIEGYILANRDDINWVRNQEGRYVPLLKEFAKGGRVGKFQKGRKTPNETQMMPFFENLTPELVKEREAREKLMLKRLDRSLLGKTIKEIMDEWEKLEREDTKWNRGPDGVIIPSHELTPLPNAIVGEGPNIELYEDGDKLPYNMEDVNSFIARIRNIIKENDKTLRSYWQEPKIYTPDNDKNTLNVPNVVEGTEQSGNTLQSELFNKLQMRLLNNNR